MGKHAIQPGSPQARAISQERRRFASRHLLLAPNRPRSSWPYLLGASACAIVVAVCIGLLVQLVDARSNDGYRYIPPIFAVIEGLVAALVLAGRTLARSQVGRRLWLWLHLPT